MPTYPAKHLYQGQVAVEYEADRATQPRWHRELSVVETILQSLPARSRVLDVPCGTGRFHPLLTKHGCEHVGADISLDMMRVGRLRPGTGEASKLVVCDAERLPFGDGSFDYVLCMRFFNLVPPEVAAVVLGEAARVTTKGIVVQVRCRRRSVLQLVPALGNGAVRRLSRNSPSRGAGLKRVVSQAGKRFPLPEARTFAEMVASVGLAIGRVYKVGRLLDPDPQRVYLLEHGAAPGR